MRIYIKSEDRKRPIRLFFPLGLLKSRLLLNIIFKATKFAYFHPQDVRKLVNELKKTKKTFPKLEIVHVEAKDGTVVKIRL